MIENRAKEGRLEKFEGNWELRGKREKSESEDKENWSRENLNIEVERSGKENEK